MVSLGRNVVDLFSHRSNGRSRTARAGDVRRRVGFRGCNPSYFDPMIRRQNRGCGFTVRILFTLHCERTEAFKAEAEGAVKWMRSDCDVLLHPNGS